MRTRDILILFSLFLKISSAGAGGSIIFYQAAQGHIGQLNSLIDDGVKIDFRDDEGRTALMHAAEFGRLEAVKLLLKRGAKANLRDNDGVTALMRASNNGHLGVARLLVEKGADPNYHTPGNKSATAYAFAKKNGHTSVASFLKPLTSIASANEPSASPLSSSRNGGYYLWAGTPTNKGSYMTWQANCDEGGYAWVNVQHDQRNVYQWGGGGFPGASGRVDVGIGVEAAMRKACGG